MRALKDSLIRLYHWFVGLPTSIFWLALACLAQDGGLSVGGTTHPWLQAHAAVAAWLVFLACTLMFVLAAYAIVIGSRPARPAQHLVARSLLVLVCLVIGIVAVPFIASEWLINLPSPQHYGSDEIFYMQYDAQLVLHGENPYAGNRLADALTALHRRRGITPVRRPPFADPRHPPSSEQMVAAVAAYKAHPATPPPMIEPATLHSYPALSFMLAVPSAWLGLPTLGFVQTLVLLVLLGGLVALAPPRWRPAVILLFLLNRGGFSLAAYIDFEIWFIAGIALVWILRWHPKAAAICLGATCAVQQLAWFFAPFYLVWVACTRGRRAFATESLIALGGFGVVNLPWMLLTPAAWWHSLFLPMTLPLYPGGVGLTNLALSGALPLWPPIVYSLLEIGALVGLVVGYTLWQRRAPYLGLVLPLLPLLLAWRCANRYFLLVPFLFILALILTQQDEQRRRKAEDQIEALALSS